MLNTQLELINGKLRAFTSVGGYPLFYLNKQEECLCVECATESFLNDEELPDFKIKYCAVNYETEMWCDQCSIEIDSAYEPINNY